jgi:phage tail-like protein
MRGLVADLATPHPIGSTLPALYQEDDFSQRMSGAFDEVLAPVFAALDGLDAYLDPRYSPEDFLDWLGSWVGITLDQTWPLERRRQMVRSAADLYRLRGTAAGLAAQVEIFSGGKVEILESGGSAWSGSPGGTMPGDGNPSLLVRVAVRDPKRLSVARLDVLVAASKPAHVPHRVEVVEVAGS